jgi:hypothetical protein
MRILGLNCQGLGNDPTIHALSDVRRRYNPEVLFLSKTHLDVFPAKCLRRRLNMDSKIVTRVMVEVLVLFFFGEGRLLLNKFLRLQNILM